MWRTQMSAGYVIDCALGFSLVLLAFLAPRLFRGRGTRHHSFRAAASRIFDAYHSSATFLALSLQVASIVVLARTDFGITHNGMGDVTVKLTWTVSVLTILPLLYCTFISCLGFSAEEAIECCQCQETVERRQTDEVYRRQTLRHYLFLLCWILSLYPFLSRMIETYGPSKIGNEEGDIISDTDWAIIYNTCHQGVSAISEADMQAINVSGIISWLLVSLLAIASMIGLGIRRRHPDSKAEAFFIQVSLLPARYREGPSRITLVELMIMVVAPSLSALQLWAYFRLQRYQEDLFYENGSSGSDLEWGFGQIVALTVFVPVLVEVWYGYRQWYRSCRS